MFNNSKFSCHCDREFTLWRFNIDGSLSKSLQRKITSIGSLDLESKYWWSGEFKAREQNCMFWIASSVEQSKTDKLSKNKVSAGFRVLDRSLFRRRCANTCEPCLARYQIAYIQFSQPGISNLNDDVKKPVSTTHMLGELHLSQKLGYYITVTLIPSINLNFITGLSLRYKHKYNCRSATMREKILRKLVISLYTVTSPGRQWLTVSVSHCRWLSLLHDSWVWTWDKLRHNGSSVCHGQRWWHLQSISFDK